MLYKFYCVVYCLLGSSSLLPVDFPAVKIRDIFLTGKIISGLGENEYDLCVFSHAEYQAVFLTILSVFGGYKNRLFRISSFSR